MSQPGAPSAIANSLLAQAGLRLHTIELLQSLWAGYGSIYRLTAVPTTDVTPGSSGHTSRSTSTANSGISTPLSQEIQSFILKLVAPPPAARSKEEGNVRKTLSYRVEHYFYTHLAPQLPVSIPVAKCVAHINEPHPDGTFTTALVMTDLQQDFPTAGESRDLLSSTQVDAAIKWLASFHGFWWPQVKNLDRSSLVRPPLQEMSSVVEGDKERGVWLNGGYTYLATRRSEYTSLANDYSSEWEQLLTEPEDDTNTSIAEMVAALLAPSEDGDEPWEEYQSIIHGDVKSENLFTSRDGTTAAFYDFQYVGLGLGVCDLAKLFTVSVPLNLLVSSSAQVPHELSMQPGEEVLLKQYINILTNKSQKEYDWTVFKRHWEMALVDWLRFQASWGFWGNTEWLEARVRHILQDGDWRATVRYNYGVQKL